MLGGLREAVGRLCCRLGWHCWRPAGYQLPGWFYCRDCRAGSTAATAGRSSRRPGSAVVTCMPDQVVLGPVVDVAAVAGPDDVIVCVPYAARLTAWACVRRQIRHGARIPLRQATRSDVGPRRGYQIADHGRCADCELGRRVAARMG